MDHFGSHRSIPDNVIERYAFPCSPNPIALYLRGMELADTNRHPENLPSSEITTAVLLSGIFSRPNARQRLHEVTEKIMRDAEKERSTKVGVCEVLEFQSRR
jgi:hypothetical protein